MRRDGVKPKGANVFQPTKGDQRTVWIIPIGNGRCLHARFPGITCQALKPTRETEVIDMSAKPVPQRPFADDPYHLDEPASPGGPPPRTEDAT